MTNDSAINDLLALDEQDFSDELGANLGTGGLWPLFSDTRLIRRTLDALCALETNLDGQIASYQAELSDEGDWLRRVTSFRGMVRNRIREAKRRISFEDRKHGLQASTWKTLAHDLAVELEQSNRDFRLDEVKAPFGLTAGEWLDRRLAKAEQKAAEQAAASLKAAA